MVGRRSGRWRFNRLSYVDRDSPGYFKIDSSAQDVETLVPNVGSIMKKSSRKIAVKNHPSIEPRDLSRLTMLGFVREKNFSDIQIKRIRSSINGDQASRVARLMIDGSTGSGEAKEVAGQIKSWVASQRTVRKK